MSVLSAGIDRQSQIEDDAEELRGFDLSPVRPLPVDQDYSQREDNSHRGGDGSHRGGDSSHRGRDSSHRGGDSSHRGGDSSYRGVFDSSHTEDTEMYRPVIEVVRNEQSHWFHVVHVQCHVLLGCSTETGI